jgi:UDP-2-acetamido-3-amino-2,3-dideoxy-glucuronate N-acetyltransferase
VQAYELPIIADLRGNLSFAELGQSLPFLVKRYFVIFDVPDHEIRGEHAHKQLHQYLVCVKGSGTVIVDDGENRDEILLDSAGIGLYLPPMVWATQIKLPAGIAFRLVHSRRRGRSI